MAVAAWAGSVLGWDRELAGLKERIGAVVSRMVLRRNASAFLDGLLSGVERKTGWLIAEQAALGRPYRKIWFQILWRWTSRRLAASAH